MNITFLIGNGFDLSLGMDTRPTSFLNDFVHKNLDDGDSPAARIARAIHEDGIETWADFEMKMGLHAERFDGDGAEANAYLEEIEALESGLQQWLSKKDLEVTDELLRENALSTFSAFASVSVLLNRNGVPLKSASATSNSLIFLCFNYTDAFLRMHTIASSVGIIDEGGFPYNSGGVIRPHGSLDTLLVCGVDNANQISNEPFRLNEDIVASVVKEAQQRNDSFNFDRDAINAIKGSDIVCIYGMSLGHSDRRWWRCIADAVLDVKCPVKYLVLLPYEINGQNLAIPTRRRKVKEEQKRRFIEAAEIDDSTASVLKPSILVYPSETLLPKLVEQS